MSKKKFIDDLYIENSSFTSDKQARKMANLLNTVSSDIYSESQRFVFELIQNADDSANGIDNTVHFDFLANSLIVSHNGKSFDEKDIASISDAGDSTKASDPTKTGYKGIGFKSVFGKSNRVSILSDGYFFRFDKSFFDKIMPWQAIPIWSELQQYSTDIQQSLDQHSYNVSTIIEISDASKLQKELSEIINNGQILLFLRFTSKIIVSENGAILYTINKKTITTTSAFTELNLYKDDKPISNWITKTFESIAVPMQTRTAINEDEKTPEKLKQAEYVEISFAAPLINGKIKSLKAGDGLIFTYLPTKVREFNFPFLVNSSFMTSAARESINEDKAWNQWLFGIIADYIFSWIAELVLTKFKFEVLNILPKKFEQPSNELKQSFDKRFATASQKNSFVITGNNAIKKVSEVLLDKTGLSRQTFLDDGSITAFLKEEKNLDFSDDCFINANVENSSGLTTIGVSTFDTDNIELFFNSNAFKSRHSIVKNFELIQYFKVLSDPDSEGIWFQALKTLPFIFDDQGILLNPSNGICFPIGITTTELGDIPVINDITFQKLQVNNPLLKWLKKLGVKEPSSVAYVANVIVPGLKDPNYINDNNFLSITQYLFRLYQNNELNDELLESLREFKLKTIGPPIEFIEAQYCYLSERYRPRFFIQNQITEVAYVSEVYLTFGSELQLNLFFKALKVKEDIEIEVIDSNNSLITMRALTNPGWVQASYNAADTQGAFGLGEHNVIRNTKIPSFINLTLTNIDYAIIFWNRLIDGGANLESLSQDARFYYGVGRGYNSHSKSVENYFTWFVKNKPCIPASNGELLLCTDVYINEKHIREIAGGYLPVFNFQRVVPNIWKNLFNFKDKLALKDYLSVLSHMTDDYESVQPRESLSIMRIGQIYNRLSAIQDDLGYDDKEFITLWSKTNKLYASNEKFESATDLSWITIEGFSIDTGNLKTIRLPSIAKDETANFRSLMVLLGVKIIDEFVPQYTNIQVDHSLKSRLEQILPYFATVINSRSGKGIDEEYDRLFSIVDETTFHSAEEIKLSFEFNDQLFEGASLTVFREPETLYFKGKWKNERTLLSLIKELSVLLNVKGLNEELRFLLLELDHDEIMDWLKEQNINFSDIPRILYFRKRLFEPEPVTTETLVHKEVYGSTDKTFSGFSEDIDDVQNDILEAKPFVPEITIDQIESHRFNFSGYSVVPQNIKLIDYEPVSDMNFRLDVGRWSEAYVNKALRQMSQFSKIDWVNENSESGKPYDFIVIENEIQKFIEVKGTPSESKNLIYLSAPEWNLMSEHKENYSFYRVYMAGTINAFFQVYENPSKMITTGLIQVGIAL
jgi:hypothetical protein